MEKGDTPDNAHAVHAAQAADADAGFGLHSRRPVLDVGSASGTTLEPIADAVGAQVFAPEAEAVLPPAVCRAVSVDDAFRHFAIGVAVSRHFAVGLVVARRVRSLTGRNVMRRCTRCAGRCSIAVGGASG